MIKSTSKEAFKKNVSTEAKSKPIKQAVAIAYSIKKEAQKSKHFSGKNSTPKGKK